MLRFAKSSLPLLLLSGMLSAGCGQNNAEEAQQVERPALTKAYDFELQDIEGKIHRLSDFKGKVVILDFWDTWCPPCRLEIPGFVELHNAYKDSGFVMIGIAGARNGMEAVRAFLKEYKVSYLNLLATRDVFSGYGGITSIPTTFIIDKNGNIVKKHIGYAPKSFFEEEIKKLL